LNLIQQIIKDISNIYLNNKEDIFYKGIIIKIMINKDNINKDINFLDNLNTYNKKEIRKFQDILNENSAYLYITFFNNFNNNG
jgi:hypothetical protein